MVEVNIAHPAPQIKVDPRKERGDDLFTERKADIWNCGPHTYRVPSESAENTIYIVFTRPGQEFCPCPDFAHRADVEAGILCKHVHAAKTWAKRSGQCADCKVRLLHRDLYEVGEDHLTWFEGDELCEPCAGSAGVR